jgi:pilus assembly protein CpaE
VSLQRGQAPARADRPHGSASVIELGSRSGEGRAEPGEAKAPPAATRAGAGAAGMLATIVHAHPSDERIVLVAKLLTRLGIEVAFADRADQVRSRSALGGRRHLVVIADDGAVSDQTQTAINLADAANGDLFVVYVADTMPVESYKRLVRTGSGEWIKWQAVPRELGDIIRTFESASPHAHAREAATIVSFFPSKGGVGNTTLAVETAVSLVRRNKSLRDRIAVVDLNFQGSTLGDALDLQSRFDIAEILARPDRLDAQLIDIFASKHASSVDVFSCVSHFGEGFEIPPDVIFAFLDQVGSRYDIVILDLPSHWQPWIDNVLQGSSAIVVTGESTVPGLRQVSHRLAHLDALGLSAGAVTVAINRCRTGLFGRVARRADMARALPDKHVLYVAADPALAAEAANTGHPMADIGSKRPVSKNIRRIGDWIQALRKRP